MPPCVLVSLKGETVESRTRPSQETDSDSYWGSKQTCSWTYGCEAGTYK